MARKMAVCITPRSFDYLKRPALYFDQLGLIPPFPNLETVLRKSEQSTQHETERLQNFVPEYDSRWQAECNWLEEKGVILTAQIACEVGILNPGPDVPILQIEQNANEKLTFLMIPDVYESLVEGSLGRPGDGPMVQFGVFSIYRSFAFLYGDSSDGDEATPLFHSMPENLGKVQLKSKHQEVIDIVINSFPEPDHNTSWEQILDFRADPGSATKLLRLRNWIREMSHGELAHYEIKEKLEWALHEYEEHLRIHKIKTANSVLRTMIVGTAEAVENILKLKLKDAANLLFFARERHVAFLQAEAEAPGRELAYVYSARQRFCK